MSEDTQPKESIHSAEDEIRELEKKLEEKKRQLSERGEETKEEKDIFREVLREHIGSLKQPGPTPSYPLQDSSTAISDDVSKKADELKKASLENQVKNLIEMALTKNISAAVRAAESTTPYILDELHDHLVDEYYDKLVQLRKLPQI